MDRITKITLWWWLLLAIYILLIFSPEVHAQETSVGNDTVIVDSGEYFIIVSRKKKANRADTLTIGDKTTIKLSRGESVRYTIQSITENSLIVVDKKGESKIILPEDIISIKKVKPNPGAVIGALALVGGIVILVPVVGGSTDFDNIAPLFLLGSALVGVGVAGIIPPPPYDIQKKSTMRFYKINTRDITKK